MGQFLKMIEEGRSQKEMGTYLDSLTHEERLREMEAVPGFMQSKLYSLSTPDLKLDDMVPANSPPLQEIIFYGKNSLPAMNIFQKRMCRSNDGKIVWGYNHQSLKWLTGPGCFIVTSETDRPGEVLIDYTKLPDNFPPQWPKLWPKPKSNTSGITALVYGHMKDYMRRVSRNVFIGEATKKGKKLNQYFILCRQ